MTTLRKLAFTSVIKHMAIKTPCYHIKTKQRLEKGNTNATMRRASVCVCVRETKKKDIEKVDETVTKSNINDTEIDQIRILPK
jgi:hypothetical protein